MTLMQTFQLRSENRSDKIYSRRKLSAVEMQQKNVAALSGKEFPPAADLQQSNVVRFFLSSTFHDFLPERNHLFTVCLPELRDWCARLAEPLDVHVADMRWGVNDHAAVDLGGVELCIREVQHCKHVSLGPSFVAFIGDRYGRRPAPKSISLHDFTKLCAATNGQPEVQLLRKWYRRDDNVVPARHVLVPVTDIFTHYLDLDNEEARKADKQRWVQQEAEIVRVLTNAVYNIQNDESAEQLESPYKYIASVTEREIEQGIFKADNPQKTALVFIRTLDGLKMNKNSVDSVKRFADFVQPYERGEIDETSYKMLHELRARLKKHLPPRNFYEFTVPFDDEKGLDPRLPAHANYLKKMGDMFISEMKVLITNARNANRKRGSPTLDPLYCEVARHSNFALGRAKTYCGRDKLLEQLYAKLSDTENRSPLVLWGDSGAGKTATVAKFVQGIWQHVLGIPIVLYRFLGTTPESSRLDKLLHSLTEQIDRVLELGIDLGNGTSDDIETIQSRFICALAGQSANDSYDKSRIVIVLDSLDQLAPDHDAHSLQWLPTRLPPNCALLVTVQRGCAEGHLETLQSQLAKQNIIELAHMSKVAAVRALVPVPQVDK